MKTNLARIIKDFEILSGFTATPGQGLTRLTFSQEDRKAREYIKEQLASLGLAVREDAAGSIIARIEGSVKGPVVLVGSHFDSVKNGGEFDGQAGVIAALETARVIVENGIKTNYPLEIVALVEEEGGGFGAGLYGSRAMAGLVTVEQLQNNKNAAGQSMYDAMREFGFNPDNISAAKRCKEELRAFIEMHIEQGPVLEKYKQQIGIVEFIVGIHQLKIRVSGRPDHAGTTPMDMRADALDTAARVIAQISKIAQKAGHDTVATVGTLSLKPGAPNIVPAEVLFTVDIRSPQIQSIYAVKGQICGLLQEITHETGVRYEVVPVIEIDPVQLNPQIISGIEDKCKMLNYSSRKMVSGAGHDAMIMAGLTDVGLIFVPSKEGRSHCPEEWTAYEDVQKGIEIVLNTVLDIAQIN
ncbi:MAG: Zn-dependent hydrolase [Peptococcaceae bacterium]